MTTIV
jgi:hypothetical protein